MEHEERQPGRTNVHAIKEGEWQKFAFILHLKNALCFLFIQEVKWQLKCTNLGDIELLRVAGARARVKANWVVSQDSPGHPQSIPAQSQLKRAGSVEGHQFPFKLKAILKSKQSRRGLRWFNGANQQRVRLKMEERQVRVDEVWRWELPIQHVKSWRQSKSGGKRGYFTGWLLFVGAVRIIQLCKLWKKGKSFDCFMAWNTL